MKINESIFLAVACLALTMETNAQLTLPSLNLSNSSCGYFDYTGIHLANTGPTGGANNQLTVGTNGDYQFISANEIRMKDYFHAGTSPGATGIFHAYIGNQQLNAAILQPSNPAAVMRYEKVEIGVDLSSIPGIDSRTATFLADVVPNYKPGTAAYNTALQNGTIINPYDPEHISIDVVFFRPSSPNANGIVRHGFYYKNYQYLGTPPTDWSPLADPYEWRIRFSPDEAGTWAGYISVWVNGQLLPENYMFTFTVTSTLANPGFVKVGPNPAYLQFSGTNDSYFPVGGNYGWTRGHYNHITYTSPGCYTLNCPFNSDSRIGPDIRSELHNYADQLSASDGNFTRLLMSPWDMQIEREKLGNYDTRQVEMWELDDYVDYLGQKNIYLLLGQINADLSGTGLGNPAYSEDWTWNPYNSNVPVSTNSNAAFKGISGVMTPGDFLTNATAKKFYKNRLRYIESRWGYSPFVAMYELLSEVDMIKDYWSQGAAFHTATMDWLDEMASYLKYDLKSHMLTTLTYTGDGFRETQLEYIWEKPSIDVVNAHSYFSREAGSRIESNMSTSTLAQISPYVKLLLIDEHDQPADAGWDKITHCTDFSMHDKAWASALSGYCGTGMPWGWKRYNTNIYFQSGGSFSYGPPNAYYGEYEKNYPALVSFISLIDLQNHTYQHSQSLQSNQQYEVFKMVRDDQQEVYGWVHNRSFNFYNFTPNCMNTFSSFPYTTMQGYFNTQPASNWYYLNSPQNENDPPNTPGTPVIPGAGLFYDEDQYISVAFPGAIDMYNYYPLGSQPIIVTGLLPNEYYNVSWYWTWGTNGGTENLAYNVQVQTNNDGKLGINVPPTGMDAFGVDHPGDWAFVLTYMPMRMALIQATQFSELKVEPNPSAGEFTLRGNTGTSAEVEIYSSNGMLLYKKKTTYTDGYTIDLSDQSPGVYLVRIISGTEVKTIRLIKN